MHAKGQVTIFVIVGLVILLLVGLYVLIASDSSSSSGVDERVNNAFTFKSGDSAISSVVTSCSRDVVVDSIPYVASTSFFAAVSNNPGGEYPYFYFAGKSFLPARQRVFSTYSEYVRDDIISCVGNFSDVRSKLSGRLSYTPENLSVKMSFSEEEVVCIVDTGATITADGETKNVPETRTEVPSRLGTLYRAAEMTVYPPEHDEEKLFTTPAFTYLDEEDLHFTMHVTPPCNQLNFIMKDEEPVSAESQLTLSYRFHGQCSG